ncbi:transcription initiation factor IIA, gamma subunit, helical domain-containing protein [Piptocephalis cylindrospora]|uniref:Transcription initiation factor IIA subunit 2 n=1 Tax=Piptocephalis cylindrospora TaxID=1907219 RepID=A0A4V1IXM3_9FUNG|nr:transcription initiation factor IIA, gamma subunit, helical domain-containing protein [Piptocephalis cylindrospora]|eukprot:RKP11559.1 transcription initiation factor IIA, gamma subunit, helical domain-containing protein [Piptocephalis cylindrospora]
MSQYYELYRRSTLGFTLTEALDELIQSGHINPQLAMRVLNQFDKTITDVLAANVNNRITFKGSLKTYRFCDDVWTFNLQDANFRFEKDNVPSSKVKIVACNSKRPGEI